MEISKVTSQEYIGFICNIMIDVSSIIILSSNRFYCSILIVIKTANRLFKKKVIEEELKELTEKIKKNKRF